MKFGEKCRNLILEPYIQMEDWNQADLQESTAFLELLKKTYRNRRGRGGKRKSQITSNIYKSENRNFSTHLEIKGLKRRNALSN